MHDAGVANEGVGVFTGDETTGLHAWRHTVGPVVSDRLRWRGTATLFLVQRVEGRAEDVIFAPLDMRTTIDLLGLWDFLVGEDIIFEAL